MIIVNDGNEYNLAWSHGLPPTFAHLPLSTVSVSVEIFTLMISIWLISGVLSEFPDISG